MNTDSVHRTFDTAQMNKALQQIDRESIANRRFDELRLLWSAIDRCFTGELRVILLQNVQTFISTTTRDELVSILLNLKIDLKNEFSFCEFIKLVSQIKILAAVKN